MDVLYYSDASRFRNVASFCLPSRRTVVLRGAKSFSRRFRIPFDRLGESGFSAVRQQPVPRPGKTAFRRAASEKTVPVGVLSRSPSGIALRPVSPDQQHDVFDVVGVREHIHRLNAEHAIVGIEQRQVAGLRGRVAAQRRRSVRDAAPRIVRATSSWIPARGGSRITTSGRPLRSTNASSSTSFMSPA